MRPMSEMQRRMLAYIRRYVEDRGYPPSIREIQESCHISSTSVVHYNLKRLEEKGRLQRRPEISRGIGLPPDQRRPKRVSVPIIGTIAAGEPIPVPSEETFTLTAIDTVEIPQEMVGQRTAVYALRVKGESMIDSLINDGDLVLMEQVQTAENGDMVAAWIPSRGEATLKKFYLEGTEVRLQPANSQMSPIRVPASDLEVQGKVIGVIRQLA